MPRILLAGIFHETHTFVDERTELKDFAVLRGAEMLACKGDGSPLGGFLEAAALYGWEILPTVDMRAQPGGMVADEVLDVWWRDFLVEGASDALRDGKVDAVYLVLHGAMTTPSYDDVEGEILERIRHLDGGATLPIFGVYDLHAHFSERMAKQASCLVGYRENPHTDGEAMAILAAELLHGTLQTESSPRMYWRHAGIVWPPTGTGTADSPMRDLEAMARRLELEHSSFLAVNVIAGFAFGDTHDTGVSFSISTTGDEFEANAALRQLCHAAWELRRAGDKTEALVDEIVKALVDEHPTLPRGPVVLVEPADNIGGGAPGDGTGLLRSLIRHGATHAAVAIADPASVSALQDVPIGATTTLDVGGKGSRLDEGPLHLEVTLVSRSDGTFHLEDRQSHLASMCGTTFHMGPCAVVKHAGVTILLSSVKTPPFDLAQWRSQGIQPETQGIIGAKAAVAHRRAYDPIASKMIWVDTPGPCRSDVRKLPYVKIRRPIWPLSEQEK
ncbi:M81 family metallopeptidase [Roseimicrobium sp. ORNL1]|uniref:M81 family metallopeptidase n=1 Tax=Roseimicrobium sp. ORNL1 TaxID=2711231 RepID=UPI0013E16479|nr:M81 family metallopeptidase [Roseimicrobium sp. ORNL1]QIF05244.1 M81 family metallopeptidase [Roseimicrobium sp. ORNL1]